MRTKHSKICIFLSFPDLLNHFCSQDLSEAEKEEQEDSESVASEISEGSDGIEEEEEESPVKTGNKRKRNEKLAANKKSKVAAVSTPLRYAYEVYEREVWMQV